ncbi:serine hydrolase domain-containing protein [Sandarakinorhabdus glacialis]|uniref:serine hydrolase domain-containing protein n=1 Tax=Sandarakinorhabdus glacialis TaxID=1614636 RepID=UPI00166A2E23|nr:serine hydrolase domain-containing protein [Polymorphobacter glacialis]
MKKVALWTLLLIAAAIGLLTVPSHRTPAAPQAAAAPIVTPQKPIPEPRASKVDYHRLEARIAQLMQMPDMVGLAVGTVENGRVTFVKGFGETVAGSGVAVAPDTVFRWASLSKSVATALVVQLAEDGKVSLDTPLSRLGTTLKLPADARRVTLAHILSHRTGLVRNAWDDRLEAGTDARLLRAELGTLPPLCPPATCYTYQNIAFDAATEVIERKTGETYARVARQRLFAPLGMTHASIGQAGLESAASWAHPYHRNKVPTAVNDSYYRVPAAGGVNSSIEDLLRWMQAQMGAAPNVLSAQALEDMHRARVSTPPHGRRGPMDRALTGAAYGLGWRSYNYAGHALVGHRGSVDGYGSLILFDPAQKSGIVMLWNSNYPVAGRLQLEFFDLLYGLPPTDWLDLQAAKPAPAPQPAGNPQPTPAPAA